MITVSVRDMKAHWTAIEKKVNAGETVTVLNRGRRTVKIVPADPEKVLDWPDHLATAAPCVGKSGEETVLEDRGLDR